jgi:hypothetical protein
VNQHSYQAIIRNQFVPALVGAGHVIATTWFQQNSAPAHTANDTKAMLQEIFGDRVITDPLWPPRSPDLTPPDFWLWGYLKGKVFCHPRPRTLDELHERIVSVIECINDDMLKRVADNVMLRTTACVLVDGANLDAFIDE